MTPPAAAASSARGRQETCKVQKLTAKDAKSAKKGGGLNHDDTAGTKKYKCRNKKMEPRMDADERKWF